MLGWYFFLNKNSAPVADIARGISPFGSGENLPNGEMVNSSIPAIIEGKVSVNNQPEIPTADLFKVTSEPVAGFVILSDKTSTTTARYVERATGHIYSADLLTNIKNRLSNQTLPKIYEAYFNQNGDSVLLRSLKNDSDMVENTIISLTPDKTKTEIPYQISLNPLRRDIKAVAVGSNNTLFYVSRDTNTITSSSFENTNKKTVLASPFTNWRLITAGRNLMIHTKASFNVPGYAYSVNINSGGLIKILGPLNGLVASINPSGTRVLYSYNENGQNKLFVKNLKEDKTLEILPATLADKCIWSTKREWVIFCAIPINGLSDGEPDNWYKGVTHFSDYIWFFDTNSNVARVLTESDRPFGTEIDVIEPKLSENEDYMAFINKLDLSLWALKLPEL